MHKLTPDLGNERIVVELLVSELGDQHTVFALRQWLSHGFGLRGMVG